MSILPLVFLAVAFFILAVGMTPSLLDLVIKIVPNAFLSKPVVMAFWIILIGLPGLFSLGVAAGVIMSDTWSVVDNKKQCSSPDVFITQFSEFKQPVTAATTPTDFKSWGCNIDSTSEDGNTFELDCSKVKAIGVKFSMNHASCQ